MLYTYFFDERKYKDYTIPKIIIVEKYMIL